MSFFCMPFLACNRQIDSYDRRQNNLQTIPHDIDRHARTLEEVLLDCNHIKELPKSLFRLQKLRRLSLGDNDLYKLPPEIASLSSLVELNLGRNDISDIPEELKQCKELMILDLSSNPITRLPATISQLSSLTHLALNDVSLTQLPADIGHLSELRSLEVRENLIRALPPSLCQLTKLQVLDLGQNELDQLPTAMSEMQCLREFYVDNNDLEMLPEGITRCRAMEQLDASENRLRCLPEEFGDLENMTDLNVSNNCLQEFPSTIGRMKKLTILKADKNAICTLTQAIGSCTCLEEVLLTSNNLCELPSSIGNLIRLKCLNVDQNHLSAIPSTIGGCSSLGVLSLRENQISELPMDIGKCEKLTVLDLCSNRLSFLPFTINVLFKLQALWLSENQSQAMLKLQQERDPRTGVKVLTCYLLPQHAVQQSEPERAPNRAFVGGPKVHFGDMDNTHDEERNLPTGNFERHGTPHPKPHANKLKKHTIDGHIIHHDEDQAQPSALILSAKRSVDNTNAPQQPQQQANGPHSSSQPRSALRFQSVPVQQYVPEAAPVAETAPSLPQPEQQQQIAHTNSHPLNYQSPNQSLDASFMSDANEVSSLTRETISSTLKRDSSGSPGFSVAGGSGRDGIYISQITVGGAADRDGKIQVGDRVLSINGISMRGARHDQAVALLTGHADNDVFLVVQRDRPSLTSPLPPQPVSTPVGTSSPQPATALTRAPSRSAPLNLLGDTSCWDGTTDEVELVKDGSSLGLSIVGGSDHSSHPFGIDSPGVFISKIAANSPAARSGRLRIGDRILAVNERDVRTAKHIDAVEALKHSSQRVRLKVQHDAQPGGLKETIIMRRDGQPLGISIHGGVRNPAANPKDPTDEGIFIDKVEHGSVSDVAGLIAGQRIIEVNGESLLGCTQQEAAASLRRANELRLLVCDGYNTPASRCPESPAQDENSLDRMSSPARAASTAIVSSLPAADVQSPSLGGLSEAPLATSSPLPPPAAAAAPKLSRIPPPVAPKPTLKASQLENIRTTTSLDSAQPEKLNFNSKLQKFEQEIEYKRVDRNVSAGQLPPPAKKPLLSEEDMKNLKEEEAKKLISGIHAPAPIDSPEKDNFFDQLLDESISSVSMNGKSLIPVRTKRSEMRAIAAGQLSPEEPLNEAERRALEQQKRSEWRAARLKSLDQERAEADAIMSRLQLGSLLSSINEDRSSPMNEHAVASERSLEQLEDMDPVTGQHVILQKSLTKREFEVSAAEFGYADD